MSWRPWIFTIFTAPKAMPAWDTLELMEASHLVQSCSSPFLFLVQPSSLHSPQAAFPAPAGRRVFQGKHGFMEVSSEEEAAHMLVSRLALTKDFAWKSGGSAGIYQKSPPCLLVRKSRGSSVSLIHWTCAVPRMSPLRMAKGSCKSRILETFLAFPPSPSSS